MASSWHNTGMLPVLGSASAFCCCVMSTPSVREALHATAAESIKASEHHWCALLLLQHDHPACKPGASAGGRR
eukprot:1256035-Rhodomonas_salina.1